MSGIPFHLRNPGGGPNCNPGGDDYRRPAGGSGSAPAQSYHGRDNRGEGRGPGGQGSDNIKPFTQRGGADLSDRVQRIEDQLQQSYESEGRATAQAPDARSRFPHRPGYGTPRLDAKTEKPVPPFPLWTNYFELKLAADQDLTLYRYNINIAADAAGRQPTGRKLRRIFELLIEEHFAPRKEQIATDFKSMLVCKSDLKIEEKQKLAIKYRAEKEDEPGPRSPTYHLEFYPRVLPVSELVAHITSPNANSDPGAKEEVIQALNVVLGHHPKASTDVVTVGANQHFAREPDPTETWKLGAGLIALRGYFMSVRPAACRLLVNVQLKHAPFYQAGPLVRLIQDHQQVNNEKFVALEKFLKGVRVEVTHIVNKNKSGEIIPRIRTIFGLAAPEDDPEKKQDEKKKGKKDRTSPTGPILVPKLGANSLEVKFYPGGLQDTSAPESTTASRSDEKKGGGKAPAPPTRKHGDDLPKDKAISVFEFFRRVHGIKLQYPNLPVVNVGNQQRPIYLPAEVCVVLPCQLSRTKLSESQAGIMTKVAVRKPTENLQAITTSGPRVLGFRENYLNPTLASLTCSLENTKMIAVPGRRLPGPPVQYEKFPRKQGLIETQGENWHMGSKEVVDGKTLPTWTWLWISVDGYPEPWRDSKAWYDNIDRFCKTLGDTGVKWPRPLDHRHQCFLPWNGANLDRTLDSSFDEVIGLQEKPRLLLVILPNVENSLRNQIYNRVKLLGDVRRGIHTICVVNSKFAKMEKNKNVQYFANVALKFNLKLGGTNQSLSASRLGVIGEGKTMVVGIDVTHPSPNSASTAPSVAALVASVDGKLAQWPAEIQLQAAREEKVSALCDMLKLSLKRWQVKNTVYPENILVYRDGVSEGQYNMVLDHELPLLRKACEETYPANGPQPNFTIVVVGKRHHTRFYPVKEQDGDRNMNPLNGTTVDRGITEPRSWDFFLQSHTALQGTARPAHYFVLQTAVDALEELTHNMCYLFGRATKAVSIPPPVYYADLVCERARCYLSKVFDPSDNERHAQQVNTNDVIIHRDLKESMFYI
ncbi:hypothetical protein W97_01390 [Coniosporium apollinis CBS 100218]|uniref:Piwi domain-containing protein n=1 Tax=Coniosporium apollinis (strain CBS 100218) TaxID=1168221 RepID=R7YJV1_CONA1|nr:uncharacterized protein W97_01390 [Coniosporium apollinis CBS 100218]EON62170.1 hypothetical protein W97_01390 [Coniosporium apollinis CBS 100218]